MVLQNKKKFYLIGTNASDIGDCTLQAIDRIKNADVVVLSKKFDSNLDLFINYQNKLTKINSYPPLLNRLFK